MNDDKFDAHLRWAKAEVDTWPEWKQNLLGLHYSKKIAYLNEEKVTKNPSKTTMASRWNNAVKLARKANELLAEGNLVLIQGERLEYLIEITETEIIQRLSERSTQQWFENNSENDHGLYTTIEDYTRAFDLQAFSPVPIKFEDSSR